MFTAQPNPKQREEMRATIEAEGDGWKRGIAKRYGAFLMEIVERDASTLARHSLNEAIQNPKGLKYMHDQEVTLSERRHMARGYSSGAVLIRDPMEAEITMRIYAQARGTAIAPAPAGPDEQPGLVARAIKKITG